MTKFKYTVALVIFMGLFSLLFPDNPGLAIFVSLILFLLIGLVSGNDNKELESKLIDRIIKLEDKLEATDVENRRLRSKLDKIENS